MNTNSKLNSRARRAEFLADINVTPFVDVLLVILVIFMVSAPLLTSGIDVDIPKSSAGELDHGKINVTVSIDRSGGVFINDQLVSIEQLIEELNNYEMGVMVFIEADRSVPYQAVIDVIDDITEAGYSRISLVTEKY